MDEKILRILRRNARIDINNKYIERLEKKGIIKRYISIIDPHRLGLISVLLYISSPSGEKGFTATEQAMEVLSRHPLINTLFRCSNGSIIAEIFLSKLKDLEVLIRVLRLLGLRIFYYPITNHLKREAFMDLSKPDRI